MNINDSGRLARTHQPAHRVRTARHARDEVTRLFAASLEDDPVAAAELRRRAIAGDPTAEEAFRALSLAEFERDTGIDPDHPVIAGPHPVAGRGRGAVLRHAVGARGPGDGTACSEPPIVG